MGGVSELPALLAAQAADGSFPSFVHLQSGPRLDHNGFATALVLDCLWEAGDSPAMAQARTRALDFLESCGQDGRFGFYPRGQQSDWMTGRLPDDADDTALITRALLRAGRIDREAARRAVLTHLRPHQRTYLTERDAPWHRAGVYHTWLDDNARRNPVDCTVNANILALLQDIGGDWPEMDAICEMIFTAIAWAGPLKARMAKLSPWYPDPCEFVEAVRRAAGSGIARLEPLSAHLEGLPWRREGHGKDLPICGSSDGRIIWTCPILSQARMDLMRAPSTNMARSVPSSFPATPRHRNLSRSPC